MAAPAIAAALARLLGLEMGAQGAGRAAMAIRHVEGKPPVRMRGGGTSPFATHLGARLATPRNEENKEAEARNATWTFIKAGGALVGLTLAAHKLKKALLELGEAMLEGREHFKYLNAIQATTYAKKEYYDRLREMKSAATQAGGVQNLELALREMKDAQRPVKDLAALMKMQVSAWAAKLEGGLYKILWAVITNIPIWGEKIEEGLKKLEETGKKGAMPFFGVGLKTLNPRYWEPGLAKALRTHRTR